MSLHIIFILIPINQINMTKTFSTEFFTIQTIKTLTRKPFQLTVLSLTGFRELGKIEDPPQE